ncbi:MAG TPA: IclR family transcriptional regulator C-terminal domain-containing protein [Magnetospirillaceae bacterium]|nr:IclR family transcriptional regulator C-terminal domain-containing protein [Magnetospirillaceae bacterium]
MSERNGTVQAVGKAVSILEHLACCGESGVSDLARAIGGQKSTVFRLLATLKDTGYILQDPETERYYLSLKLFRIGSGAIRRLDIDKAALTVVGRLAKMTSETVHLCILDSDQVLYLHKIESTYSLKVAMASRIGGLTPLYCTGVGKTLLAWQDDDYIRKYLRGADLVRHTERTITDPMALASELQKIRLAGYAYDDEEHELGVRCAAAPIFDMHGQIAAALSVSGPSVRLTDRQMETFRELVKDSAAEISSRLGYDPVSGK